MKKEIFKRIGETNYEVSNTGKIRNRNTMKELKLNIQSAGYAQIGLWDQEERVSKRHMVHRLVAEAFIPNPENLPQINHKDENKLNNNVENLEWCTHEYNMDYGTRGKRQAETMNARDISVDKDWRNKLSEAAKKRGYCADPNKKVIVILTSRDGNSQEFVSARAAAKFLGVNNTRIHYNAGNGHYIKDYKIEKKYIDKEVKEMIKIKSEKGSSQRIIKIEMEDGEEISKLKAELIKKINEAKKTYGELMEFCSKLFPEDTAVAKTYGYNLITSLKRKDITTTTFCNWCEFLGLNIELK